MEMLLVQCPEKVASVISFLRKEQFDFWNNLYKIIRKSEEFGFFAIRLVAKESEIKSWGTRCYPTEQI